MMADLNLYWGDLHNPNELGYAQGSLKRCYEIAAKISRRLAIVCRMAWSNADTALQIHGGNGYSMEFEIGRVLCDVRILNIFAGAGEIQAHVIGRGLLSAKN